MTPFLLFSIALGGVELRALSRLAVYGTAMTAALSIATLFAAAVPVTRVQRTGMQLIMLVGLVLVLGLAFTTVKQLVTAHDPALQLLASEHRDGEFLLIPSSPPPAWSCSRRRRRGCRCPPNVTRAGRAWRSRC